MKRVSMTASLLALTGVLSFAPLFADEPAETKTRTTNKTQKAEQDDDKGERSKQGANADQGDAAARTRRGHHAATMPACLEKLNLNEEQQTKVREIVGKYDAETEEVWNKFKHAYRDTIRTEVLLITAIEDNLTDEQQQQVRSARRMRAHEAKVSGKTKGPARAVSDTASRTEARIKAETGVATEGEGRPGAKGEKDPAGVIGATALSNITLTEEQEEIAQELHDKYYSRLRSLNRQVDALHTRLVALEADELAEIETALNKEQIEQLREIRKEAPVHKVADRDPEAKSSNDSR